MLETSEILVTIRNIVCAGETVYKIQIRVILRGLRGRKVATVR